MCSLIHRCGPAQPCLQHMARWMPDLDSGEGTAVLSSASLWQTRACCLHQPAAKVCSNEQPMQLLDAALQSRALTLLLLVGCAVGLLLRRRAIVGPHGRVLLMLRRRRRPVLLLRPRLILLLLRRLVVLLRGPCRIVSWS